MVRRDKVERDMMKRGMERRFSENSVNSALRRSLSAYMQVHGAHRNLLAWQEAMKLVAAVYQVTESFPRSELYGLTAQARRAAVSIPSNIAEGAARNSTREYVQFLGVATGSLSELETQLELGMMLKYVHGDTEILRHTHRVGRLLTALRTSLREKAHRE